jgi:uncharacterized protein DUF2252
MMQAGTDIFLGWTPNPGERTAFLCAATEGSTTRRCRNPSQNRLPFYAALCGRTLAPAHARAGGRRIFGLYDKEFDKTIAEFAMPYADQTKRDWRAPGCDQKGAPGRRGATRFANLTPQRLGSAKSRTPDLSDPGAALGTDA